jgi:hypothetical protein
MRGGTVPPADAEADQPRLSSGVVHILQKIFSPVGNGA